MTDKLKPCPFCGSEKVEITQISEEDKYYLQCKRCRIEQPIYRSMESAVEAWNTRADERAKGEWIKDEDCSRN